MIAQATAQDSYKLGWGVEQGTTDFSKQKNHDGEIVLVVGGECTTGGECDWMTEGAVLMG